MAQIAPTRRLDLALSSSAQALLEAQASSTSSLRLARNTASGALVRGQLPDPA
jgi:hypothetical protein